MAFRGENVYPSNIKVNRTSHLVTQAEVTQGWLQIAVKWDPPFPDANYTMAQTITNPGALDNNNDYSIGDNHLVTASGFTQEAYVNSGAASAGATIILNTIAIHDLALLP
jgi:hypothetical protein